MSPSLDTVKWIGIGAVAIPIVYLSYRTTRAAHTVSGEVEAFAERRRERDQNVFHGAANAVTEVVTLDKGQTLGGAVFDALNKYDPETGTIIGPGERLRRFFGGAPQPGGASETSDGLRTIEVRARRL